jgi:hypothetical protein
MHQPFTAAAKNFSKKKNCRKTEEKRIKKLLQNWRITLVWTEPATKQKNHTAIDKLKFKQATYAGYNQVNSTK